MKLFKFIAVFFLALTILSCSKKADVATGVGDAVIIVKQSGTNTVYGVSLFAYTLSAFQSVKAISSTAPEKPYTLKANQGYNSNFYLEPADNELTTTKPAAATYKFSATFENGATDVFENELTDKVVAPTIIDTCRYISTRHLLRVVWKEVAGADSYSISIYDGSKVVFGSFEITDPKIKAYSVVSYGGGWASGFTPESGKTYTVKVYAYLYEPSKTSYTLQSVSVAESSVVWGN
jgi:hypothetical protein